MTDPTLKPVTREEFFACVCPLNVHPRIVSSWPYRSEWRLQDNSRKLIGISQEQLVRPEYPCTTIYYLVQ
jgi:hypothetical protein